MKHQSLHRLADFVGENWADLLSAAAAIAIVALVALVETSSPADLISNLGKASFALIVIVLIRLMALGLQLKSQKAASLEDLFTSQLVLPDGLLEGGVISVTLVGRLLSTTIEHEYPKLAGVLRAGVPVTVNICDPDDERLLERLVAEYGHQFSAQQHAARLRGVIATLASIAQSAGDQGEKLDLHLSDIAGTGGVVVRKTRGAGMVGIEIYIHGAGPNLCFWVAQRESPALFEQLADHLEAVASSGRRVSLLGE